MEDLKIYQVKSGWTTFRIPFGTSDIKESDKIYSKIEEWLDNNMHCPYKLFRVSDGYAKSFFIDGKRSDHLSKQKYHPLMQVDIYDSEEAALFKLTWG